MRPAGIVIYGRPPVRGFGDDTHRLFGIPRTDLSQGPDILARKARYFSMKSGLLLTKVSTPKSTRTRKAVIASP